MSRRQRRAKCGDAARRRIAHLRHFHDVPQRYRKHAAQLGCKLRRAERLLDRSQIACDMDLGAIGFDHPTNRLDV